MDTKYIKEHRVQQYNICRERGHRVGTSFGDLCNPETVWSICKFCNTTFRYEQKLIEEDSPEGDK